MDFVRFFIILNGIYQSRPVKKLRNIIKVVMILTLITIIGYFFITIPYYALIKFLINKGLYIGNPKDSDEQIIIYSWMVIYPLILLYGGASIYVTFLYSLKIFREIRAEVMDCLYIHDEEQKRKHF